MNSSTSMPSMVGGLFTRFCLPFTKMIIVSWRRFFFARFSALESLRFDFGIGEF